MFSISPTKSLFTYAFKDPKGSNKILIGCLLIFANFIIPLIPAVFVYGYAARIARRISREDGELVLPEWKDWGALFSEGFKILMAGLIYSLPAILIMLAGTVAYFMATFGMAFESSSGNDPSLAIILYFFSLFLFMISIVVAIGFMLIAAFFAPAAIMNLIHEKRFSAAFQIGTWWPIFRRNMTGFVFVFVLTMGLGQIVMLGIYILMYSLVLSFLVPFITSFLGFYMLLIVFPLFGQAYKEGLSPGDPHSVKDENL